MFLDAVKILTLVCVSLTLCFNLMTLRLLRKNDENRKRGQQADEADKLPEWASEAARAFARRLESCENEPATPDASGKR